MAIGLCKMALHGVNDNPSFDLPLTTTLIPKHGTGLPTFTRADSADYIASVIDFEGLIKYVRSGEARFQGARRVENLIINSESGYNQQGTIQITRSLVSYNNEINVAQLDFPQSSSYGSINAGSAYSTAQATLTIGKSYIGQRKIAFSRNLVSGEAITMVYAFIQNYGSLTFTSANSPSTNLTRYCTNLFIPTDTNGTHLYVYSSGTNLYSPLTIYITQEQIEDVSGQSNQNPSEYVSRGVLSSPYHGANVDGVKYFDTYNGNTVSNNIVIASNSLTMIPAATLQGYLSEGQRQNLIPYSRVFSNWNDNGITVTDNNMIAPDGTMTAGTCSTIGGSGTRYVTISVISGNTYVYSLFIKPPTPGTAQELYWDITGGMGYVVIIPSTGAISSSTGTYVSGSVRSVNTGGGWYRISAAFIPTATGNMSIHIVQTTNSLTGYWGAFVELIYTSGIILYPQASSYIATNGTTVTRIADMLYYDVLNIGQGTFSIIFTMFRNIDAIAIPSKSPIEIGSYAQNADVMLGGYTTNSDCILGQFSANGLWDANIHFGDALINNATHKVGYKLLNDLQTYACFYNGAKRGSNGVSASPKTIPWKTPAALSICGANLTTNNNGQNTCIKNIKIWKQALSDSKMVSLVT
jgi:hypothetical protein